MTGKTDFTEAEWETLEKSVTGTGMLVALADSKLFDSFKEAGALAGHLNDARQKSSSQLIRDLAATRGTGFGLGTSPQAVETETLAALRGGLAILRAKAPNEVSAYTEFVRGVAGSVANAVSGVAPSESEAIKKIEGALNTAS